MCVVSGHDGKGFAPKAFVVLKAEFANKTEQMTIKLKNECEKTYRIIFCLMNMSIWMHCH